MYPGFLYMNVLLQKAILCKNIGHAMSHGIDPEQSIAPYLLADCP